jgi:ribosomal protein S18 acetylase RimI-like enzyme
MSHILDNPAWNALATGNRNLGLVNGTAGYFQPVVSPFVALAEPTCANLVKLHEILPFRDTVILVSNQNIPVDAPWNLIVPIRGFQMVYEGRDFPDPGEPEPRQLTESHVPEMQALTNLTNPGPFLTRTIEFGHYQGFFENDELIAMAGQRMHPTGFAEVSAVCTHPAHLGKGYAKKLLLHQINRIQHAGDVPFLHVKADNQRAINVYKYLGFKVRTEIFFIVMKKEE